MKKSTTLKKGGVFILSAILAMSMGMASVFAASDDATRQANSSATATINLEKTLTVNQANKFPNVEDFHFTFERVKAWDNANTSTAQNGAAIAKSDIPMPAASETAHHTVTAVNADKVTVATGNYTTANSWDTTTARTNFTNLPITYTKAGYYVYKVNEVDEGVAGITYDSDAYYVVVYVANNQDGEGNTTTGVYVHSITIWENIPSISSIGNVNNGQDIGTDPDNPQDAEDKKGVTPPEPGEPDPKGFTPAPNAIRVNFDNLSSSNDIIISKNVKGSLGDKTKQFEFTVTLTGLVAGTTYDVTGTGTVVSASVGTWDGTGKKITPNASGAATLLVKMTDDQTITLSGMPVGAKYTVSEAASDHIASYSVTSNAETVLSYVQVAFADMEAGKTYYLENDGTDTVYVAPDPEAEPVQNPEFVYEKVSTKGTIAKKSDANDEKETALATAQETVDANDGTVTVAYTNTRNIATITGVAGADYMLYGVVAMMMVLASVFVIRRRKAYSEELM